VLVLFVIYAECQNFIAMLCAAVLNVVILSAIVQMVKNLISGQHIMDLNPNAAGQLR
jgi:hypothetical protein